jgi:hypothetical protein
MQRVQLSDQQKKELAALAKVPLPNKGYQGTCEGCGRRIPYGYLCRVSEWSIADWSGMHTLHPAKIWCKDCRHLAPKTAARTHRRRVHHPPVEETPAPVLTAKEIALALLKVMGTSADEAAGSKKLARLAGVEYSELTLKILKKLYDAGKVAFAEGKWYRA